MNLPSNHPAIPKRRVGVLLMNLGTPDDPSPRSVRRYLAEFLSDRRVVELPPIAWQPILRGIILNTRPKKSAHAYQQVWSERGSPLAAITRAQSEAMQGAFGDGVVIDWAMRYGNPSIASRIESLREQGCDRILLAPLYPQYCAATTATANDKAFAHLAKLRWQPAIRTLPPYYDDPLYIDALASTLREDLAKLDFEPDAIVASFHGMPRRTLQLGDPYHCHCQKTARLVQEALGRPLTIAFQSRFGPAKWLGPATDETLVELAKAGKRRVAIFAPGFSADCLETLEELAIRGKESFEEAGGTDFAYLPCLNAEPTGNKMLRNIIARELAGWIDAA
ncbi:MULTISPECIES: ferrochelatase [unclassified Sphingomonas]|uniref:ferrochelatase n=1 Tax=unclassified Sphingomonas TaxID=196159 RepID=UPI0006F719DD|nr:MULTISPECIES: ferrochelatase [unclassified Sphingomonas]KQM63997.1 ferrochelatase [Sphingomonas sp. Leaf16]KQN13408.1 ferrochelatase [Sphingomonas sp. Leaf29]KQN21292.1 ferrochelatase [Sphingomonas sp. Leaf32]